MMFKKFKGGDTVKKNIYMVQPNYLHGNSTYFPFAVGTLIAKAKADERINKIYDFKEIIFLRENTDTVLEKMDEPAVVGFSNYIWNYEYNKLLASKIRKKYPECIIIFGGHHIGENEEVFGDCPFADYFIFGEGEEVFSKLLLALAGFERIEQIPNIAYRHNENYNFTYKDCMSGTDYPSPYLTGCFDNLLKDYPSLNFYAIIETSRGCPYNCKYCDWGNLDSKKVKFFPIEKIYAELEWLAAHGIDGLGGADANFGIVKRDEDIIDKMIDIHNKTKHIQVFQTSYAKNSNDIVFNMTKKLNECGMNKGVTLSFQSLSEEALKNVGRENIPIENYKSLLRRYSNAGIATYTELILGLPGETFESFVDGIEILLEAGQHHAIYIHNCEYLPCAGMSNKEYTEKFKIKTIKIPLNQPHREASFKDETEEYSRIVTSTYSMSEEDWVRSNVFSCIVQCFHHGGLLSFFAMYLFKEEGLKYIDFYTDFIKYIKMSKDTLLYKIFTEIENRLYAVIKENKSLTFVDERFGNVIWPAEEYFLLNMMYNLDSFFEEINPFLKKYFKNADFLEQLIDFQKSMLKKPNEKTFEKTFKYNFCEYFNAFYKNECVTLKKKRSTYIININKNYNSFIDYAKYSVWYGRKESGNLNLNVTESVID